MPFILLAFAAIVMGLATWRVPGLLRRRARAGARSRSGRFSLDSLERKPPSD